MTEIAEPGPHECLLPETRNFQGKPQLGPCTVCGRPASAVLEQLRSDRVRDVVRRFLVEAPRFLRASMNTQAGPDSDRWHGQALARTELFDRLKEAGVDVSAMPLIDGNAPPAPRNAIAVRRLHVLESLGGDAIGAAFTACKADGYISDNLETDPCPTLAALNETDPDPGPPIIDTDRLAGRLYGVLEAALGAVDDPGWSLSVESRRAADALTGDLPTIDLADPAIRREIGRAIAAPSAYVPRHGAVPEHQLDAVIAVLRKATK